MATYLRPKRGTVGNFPNELLLTGEILLDNSKSSSNTTLDSWGRIFVGNGTDILSNLKPFIGLPEEMIVDDGIDSHIEATTADIKNGKSVSALISVIKNELEEKAAQNTISSKEYNFTSTGFKIIITKIGRLAQIELISYNPISSIQYQEVKPIGQITDAEYLPLFKEVYFPLAIVSNDQSQGTDANIMEQICLHIKQNGSFEIISRYPLVANNIEILNQTITYISE